MYLWTDFYFTGNCIDYSEYLDTLAKLTPLKQKAKFYYALFSESGFDDKTESAAEENDVRLYTFEDIVTSWHRCLVLYVFRICSAESINLTKFE